MAREARRVPPDWQHPGCRPLRRGYAAAWALWMDRAARWVEGLVTDFAGGWRRRSDFPWLPPTYPEFAGRLPAPEDFMPEEQPGWPLQMYSMTLDLPLSPVLGTPEELARWLAENHVSLYGGRPGTYEEWRAVIARRSL